MKLVNLIFNLFGINLVMTPNGILKKFFKESKKKFIIFEMYYKKKLIIQLENEKYVDKKVLKETRSSSGYGSEVGYMLSFAFSKKNIELNDSYKNYLLASHSLNMKEIDYTELGLIGFYKRYDSNISIYEIGDDIKNIILSVYKFKEENPKIVYNLRYPKKVRSPSKLVGS